MPISDFLTSAIDRVVSIASPRAGIRRHLERKYFARLQNGDVKPNGRERTGTYAAANAGRLHGNWSPANTGVNDLVRASNPALRAETRQLIRDFPIFARAVNVTIDHSVGAGLGFQSRIKDSMGNLDNPLIEKVEDSWKWFADEADVAGKMDIYDLMRLSKRQEVEGGAFLLVKRYIKDRKRHIPFCLQSIEPDLLSNFPGTEIAKGNEIDTGIEYEKETGRPVKYHFMDPDGWGKVVSVPAEYVIHGFDTLRAGQLHGVTPFASGILLAKDLMDYLDTEIDAAKSAGKWLAFVTKEPGASGSSLDDGTGVDEGKKIMELENAIIEYLGQGENIEIATNPRPGTNFPPTVKLILCLFSAATGVPYELLSFDYGGINYTSTRVIRNDFIQSLKPITRRFEKQFCNPVGREFFSGIHLRDRVRLPGYMQDPQKYFKWEWCPPGTEMIDWLKESKAKISEVGVSLRTPQEILKARGRDWGDVVKETAAAVKQLKEAKLDFLIPIIWKSNSLASASNPAAVSKQNSNGNRALIEAHAPGVAPEVIDMLEQIMDSIQDISNN